MIEDSKRLISKAEDSLIVAKELFASEHFSDSISKSYYVMFYSAQALLLNSGIERVKHSGVISAFGHHFARTNRIEPRFHRMIIKAQKDREIADYDIYKMVDEGLAEKRLKDAAEFLKKIKEYLQ